MGMLCSETLQMASAYENTTHLHGQGRNSFGRYFPKHNSDGSRRKWALQALSGSDIDLQVCYRWNLFPMIDRDTALESMAYRMTIIAHCWKTL